MPSRTRCREAAAGGVVLLGVLSLLPHLYHLLGERSSFGRLVGVYVPMLFSLTLVGAGVWLHRSEFERGGCRIVTVWTGVGFLSGIAFGYPTVLYQAAHGVSMYDVPYLVVIWGTVGALGGFLVGYYDARQRGFRRELELERNALATREQELEQQNERLERFASVVSHDLRNPLNVAAGNLALAREETDTARLETVAEALERMEDLVADLLELARQGGPIDETEAVGLSSMVEACWGAIDARDASVAVEGDLRFAADPDRLRQLLENLLRNAVEHGGGDVAVEVGTLGDGRGFYVADDGPGIPATERESFLEFGHSGSDGGSGLGLAIVAEIAEAHGWEVTVGESESGGARVEIRGVDPCDDSGYPVASGDAGGAGPDAGPVQ